MDIKTVGAAMSHQAKVDTLEKVSISVFKTANKQAEQHAAQILESIEPAPQVEGNKGKNVNFSV